MNKPWKGIGLAAAALIVASSLAACGSTESTVTKVDEPKETAASDQNAEQSKTEVEIEEPAEQAEEESEKYGKIGETMQFDDLKITLKNVRKTTGTDEWDKPEKDHFLFFDVVVENAGDEPAAVSSALNFSLLDADGYSQDFSISLDAKGSVDGEIGPGRKIAGEIVYDVEDSDSYEFIFEDPFTQGQAIWQMGFGDIAE